jgi:predicted dehydrogenase
MKGPTTAILIGAGSRGWYAYGNWALKNKDKLKFLAVAEPRKERREGFARDWNIPKERQFEDWSELLNDKIGKVADACLICTQDRMHTEPALTALELGYHVLLEKPMAATEEECKELVRASEKVDQDLRICHVLRYTTMFSKIKDALKEGMIGDIITIQYSENVSPWHFAHAYVRGNWRRAENSTPLILAKSCHDLDILYWLVESPTEKIQSFGELSFYTEDNAPKGAPKRCTDGCPVADTCPWYAPRLYIYGEPLIRITQRSKKRWLRFLGKLILNQRKFMRALSYLVRPLNTVLNWQYWPSTVIADDLSVESKMQALKQGPWGKCVFRCDNNVLDHQTVNIVFKNGVTAVFTVHGFSFLDGRWIRISGTKGSLLGHFTYGGEKLTYYDHRYRKEEILWEKDISLAAHSDGDSGLMESFTNSLLEKRSRKNEVLTSARASLESHLMGFAAEKSRKEGNIINMEDLRE